MQEANALERADIRLIMSAVGTSARIGQEELEQILAEIESRKDTLVATGSGV
jgi:hypothetical protein